MLNAGWTPPGQRHTWTRPKKRPLVKSEKWRKANGWRLDEKTKLFTVLPERCLSEDAQQFMRDNKKNVKMGCNQDWDEEMRKDAAEKAKPAQGVGSKRGRKEK